MQQFEECTALVDKALAQSNGRCEYALHVKALIARQRGEKHLVVCWLKTLHGAVQVLSCCRLHPGVSEALPTSSSS